MERVAKSAQSKTAASSAKKAGPDAIALLTEDHRKVKKMFQDFSKLMEAMDEDNLMDEAEVEHQSCKELIAQLESMDSDDDHYDAKVVVLGEYIDHHVKEEHEEMFPKAKKAKVDMADLGAQMAARKEELMAG